MSNMDFETQVRSIGAGMEYPPTPDIAGSVVARIHVPRRRFMSQTLARSLVLVLVLLASLLFIPPVRAAVLDFIQIGIVRIFRTGPAPVPKEIPSTMLPVTATPVPTLPSLIPLLEQMTGETTLTDAQQTAEYPILLPTYPTGLGEPDRVFIQDADGPMTILMWVDHQHPDRVKMSLHFIPDDSWAIKKMEPMVLEETRVNNLHAVWTEGPYVLLMQNGGMRVTRMIDGHVLIWEDGGVTYRLETDLSMEEAVKIAESLEQIP
jgi:hypothetical protein